MENTLTVRDAKIEDTRAIAEIYNHEVQTSEANYESLIDTSEKRTQWLTQLQDLKYPVLVAELNQSVVGFAALTPFHPLSGYRFTATGSVYIAKGHRGEGVGRALLEELRIRAKQKEIHSIVAGVNSKNNASIGLLKSFGFQEVGFFKEIGFKNGVWLDDVCLQLHL